MVNINDLVFSYDKSSRKILNDIHFDIKPNECIAILGNNGAGKSTLLKCIDRILPVEKGTVLIDDQNIYDITKKSAAQQIAYVPQYNKSINMTVFDAILLGRKPYITWDTTVKDHAIVENLIKQMHLEHLTMKQLSELSGGEVQKVMLTRALAQNPSLLLLDEPTSNLDPRNQHKVLQTIRKIGQKHQICMAIVLHDLNLAIRYCNKFIFLKNNQIFAYGGEEIMTAENIEAVYNLHVHIIKYMDIPVIIPFPDEKTAQSRALESETSSPLAVNPAPVL